MSNEGNEKCYFCGSTTEEAGELKYDKYAAIIHKFLDKKGKAREFICKDCLDAEDYQEIKNKAICALGENAENI